VLTCTDIAQAAAAARRILSFRIRDEENSTGTSEIPNTTGGIEIELKDVWFRYPTRDIPIFTGLNIKIEKGQFAALVGASGMIPHLEIRLQETDFGLRMWQNQHNFSS